MSLAQHEIEERLERGIHEAMTTTFASTLRPGVSWLVVDAAGGILSPDHERYGGDCGIRHNLRWREMGCLQVGSSLLDRPGSLAHLTIAVAAALTGQLKANGNSSEQADLQCTQTQSRAQRRLAQRHLQSEHDRTRVDREIQVDEDRDGWKNRSAVRHTEPRSYSPPLKVA